MLFAGRGRVGDGKVGGLLVSLNNMLVGLSHRHYVRGFRGLKLHGIRRLLSVSGRSKVLVRRRGNLVAPTRFHGNIHRVVNGMIDSGRVSTT